MLYMRQEGRGIGLINKLKAYELQEDGTAVERKYVDFRFTVDERIVDGFYYASFLKYFRRMLRHPEVLDNPPEVIVKDIV